MSEDFKNACKLLEIHKLDKLRVSASVDLEQQVFSSHLAIYNRSRKEVITLLDQVRSEGRIMNFILEVLTSKELNLTDEEQWEWCFWVQHVYQSIDRALGFRDAPPQADGLRFRERIEDPSRTEHEKIFYRIMLSLSKLQDGGVPFELYRNNFIDGKTLFLDLIERDDGVPFQDREEMKEWKTEFNNLRCAFADGKYPGCWAGFGTGEY